MKSPKKKTPNSKSEDLVAFQVDPELEAEKKSISQHIDSLVSGALEGNEKNLKLLHFTAQTATWGLVKLQSERFEATQEFASTQAGWPVLLSMIPQGDEMMISLVRKLNLGSKTRLHVNPAKIFNRDAPIKKIAVLLVSMIEALRFYGMEECDRSRTNKRSTNTKLIREKELQESLSRYRADYTLLVETLFYVLEVSFPISDSDFENLKTQSMNLPELTASSWKAWFKVAKTILFTLTEDRPEEVPLLRSIGYYRADAISSKKAGAPILRGQIRQGIVEKMRRAYQEQLPAHIFE